ncbi:MAG: hypothetical protein R8M45_11510 [Ghiorsea sp.]
MDFEGERTALLLHKKTTPLTASLLWAGLSNIDHDISFKVRVAIANTSSITSYMQGDSVALYAWIMDVEAAYSRRHLHRLDESDKEEVRLYEKGVNFLWEVDETAPRILNIINGTGSPDYVTLEQLRELAAIRGEKPLFLFPEAQPSQENNTLHPKTRQAWLKLIAALCIECGKHPKGKGMIDAVTAVTQSNSLDEDGDLSLSRSTVANILSEVRVL